MMFYFVILDTSLLACKVSFGHSSCFYLFFFWLHSCKTMSCAVPGQPYPVMSPSSPTPAPAPAQNTFSGMEVPVRVDALCFLGFFFFGSYMIF